MAVFGIFWLIFEVEPIEFILRQNASKSVQNCSVESSEHLRVPTDPSGTSPDHPACSAWQAFRPTFEAFLMEFWNFRNPVE